LVGSDAGYSTGKGIPRKAFYIFDVKSEMELEKHNIKFVSCQDLLEYYQKETGTNGKEKNVYELVQFFIKKNPNGYYLLDEVPLIKGNYGEYTARTIKIAKEFILKCKQLLGEKQFLWIAFQSNTLNDRSESSDDFKDEFDNMIDFLRKELNFYSPNLTLNMRNSSEVGNLAKSLKSSDRNEYKITNVIQSLPTPKSSITSPKPTLFPVLEKDLKQKFLELFEKATEEGKINVILISSTNTFDVEPIKEALIECGIEEIDIFIHTFKSNNSKEDIKEFLSKEKAFLICGDELFTGMEAHSILYCASDDDFNKNLRVHVMRACSKLNIVYSYETDIDGYIDFSGAKLDPTFMKGCDEEMERFAFQCLTCQKKKSNNEDEKEDEDDIFVCKSCLIGCHSGHDVKSRNVRSELKKDMLKCDCKTKCLNCNIFQK